MNREMQSKLVAILRDAMNAQGITQNDLARKIGTSSGMISQAFSSKAQMREERWRMCCEFCGVDFDHFMESQSSPVQSSPVQSSPVQSSPVQSSPVQSSPNRACAC